jgi:23S rRNA pseudouridine1911/1915/1917 synthase
VAKNDMAHTALSAALERHDIVREYHMLAKGGFKEEKGTLSYPIGRHPVDRKKMAVLLSQSAHAKNAVTHYEVIERLGEVSYVKARLETGRTHQIRVHMAYIGHPLLGDEVYGGSKIRFEKLHAPLLDGQILHAKKLILNHPKTGEKMEFESPLPKNFERLLQILRNKEGE